MDCSLSKIMENSVRNVSSCDLYSDSHNRLSGHHADMLLFIKHNHVIKKIFDSAQKTVMLICKITLPDSPHPVIISKNPGFWALYLTRQNKFRFFV